MTVDEALTLQEANPTDLSDLASILASWHTLGAEVRRLRDRVDWLTESRDAARNQMCAALMPKKRGLDDRR